MKASIIRHAQNDTEFRGRVLMSIELSETSKEDQVCNAMSQHGFKCPVGEESEKYEGGSSLVYMIDSDEVEDFRLAWKAVKKDL
jgi:hypothetical protein